ncbi:MAG: alkaline phosphatase family protein, partial [Bacteroidales bacterium]|nr:alkaline phosphatase family protein [Bacteroidales bacterium]
QLPDVFYGIRLDAVTFNMAFEYLKSEKPRFLFIALDETDDFGHHGSYDYYLNSARYTDDFIKQLWNWLQSDADYRDQTTLIIAVDHGRGTGMEGWKSHGKKTANSDETWFAVIGPDTPALGEIREGQYYNSQYAGTMSYLLGFDYKNERPVGKVIEKVIGR